MHKSDIKLLVCDLDNTLYDWVGFFVPAFYAMVNRVVEITGCDRETLLDDLHAVHQKHHDSEHPFALLETSFVRTRFPGQTIEEIKNTLDPAFHAYNSARKRSLALHPGVRETLNALIESNVKLVAHTESKLYAIVTRFKLLGLTDYFSRIYCRERSFSEYVGSRIGNEFLNEFPMHKVVELSGHQTKPNVDVLLEICSREGVSPTSTAYVGDSMARDILMAKQAGVYAIWAAYGARHDMSDYERLVRISHWTEEDVARERELRLASEQIHPDFTAHGSFAEILSAILPGADHVRGGFYGVKASG